MHVWLSHYCICTEWCIYPPQIIQQSLLLAVCMIITYDGHTGRRRLDCVPLLYLRVADTLTLNSQLSLSHSHTCCESSRVRTDGGTYILLDYYYCSYSIITQQQQQQQQQSTYARKSTLTATTCSRSTNSST